MANNNVLFDAAYSGALAGLASRWVKDESIVASEKTIVAAVAFATEVDALIPAGSFTTEQGELLYSLCSSVWEGRIALSDVPSNYLKIATSIVGLFNDGIPNLLAVPSGGAAGAINKYTTGPAFSGAQFATVQDAVDQAVADGVGGLFGGAAFYVYPGYYGETVTIPESLANFHFQGIGSGVGSFIREVIVNLPEVRPQTISFSFSHLGITNLSVNRPISDGLLANMRMHYCEVYTTAEINGLDLDARLDDTEFIFAFLSFVGRELRFTGGKLQSPTGSSGTALESNTAQVTRLTNVQVAGRLNVGGLGISMLECFQEHDGSPAVSDACTSISFCQGNTFSHNAGPAGPVWVKTGPSNFHDGGNTFAEGQVYPWFDVASGTRSARSEGDNELRNVLTVSGSPTLTPAQVGGQRKTTVVKSDGGGLVTLPLIGEVEPGCTILLKDDGNATASPWTFRGSGAEKIDEDVTKTIGENYQAIEVQAGTASWHMIGVASLPRSVETFSIGGVGGLATTLTTRGTPIWLPAGFRVNSLFTYFGAAGTATNYQQALYSLDGATQIAAIPDTVIVPGLQKTPVVTPAIIQTSGWYILVLGFSATDSGEIVVVTATDATFGCASLGGTYPLPATITPTNESVRYYGGVSEV